MHVICDIFFIKFLFSLPKSLVFLEALLKRKWKYLRDQFAVELGKFPPARSGDVAGDTPTSKWKYFQLLLFLKDVIKPRALTGNFSSLLENDTAETSLSGSSQLDYQTDEVDVEWSDESTSASPPDTQDAPVCDVPMDKQRFISISSLPKKKRTHKRPKTKTYNQNILDLEKQKVQYLIEKANRTQDTDDDEDLMFFKSLLPHVKKIPPANKLTFRCLIQELVQHFAYQVPVQCTISASKKL